MLIHSHFPFEQDVCEQIEGMPETGVHPLVSQEDNEASSSNQKPEPKDLKPGKFQLLQSLLVSLILVKDSWKIFSPYFLCRFQACFPQAGQSHIGWLPCSFCLCVGVSHQRWGSPAQFCCTFIKFCPCYCWNDKDQECYVKLPWDRMVFGEKWRTRCHPVN